MSALRRALALTLCLVCVALAPAVGARAVVVGSKTFGESHILGEICAQLLEARGFDVQRKLGLGGTLVTYEALTSGALDVYPEYSGTLLLAVLQAPALNAAQLDAALAAVGLRFDLPLGFNNSYAIAVADAVAVARGLQTISDLRAQEDLRVGLSHEFLNRADGWPALRERYGLPQSPVGIDHALAYRALASGQLDVTDAYTTDGELARYRLRLLRDDLGLFPVYNAGLLTRSDLGDDVRSTLRLLTGSLDEGTMRDLNRQVVVDGRSPAEVAAGFLRDRGLAEAKAEAPGRFGRIARNTLVHLKLTGTALLLACAVAVPLALLLFRWPRAARAFEYVAGLVQTIPALALLALLIPVLGLGQGTAILALFLYSLLPIARNTLAGLAGVDPLLREVAAGLGLTRRQQLLKIEFPLALPMIVAGIKTAAVISIGTATLAAFVGAGGLGEPIITGLSLSDHQLILEGALPAAALAVITELLFELVDRRLLPAQLRA